MNSVLFYGFALNFLLFTGFGLPSPALANEADQASVQVEQILETRSCPGCDLRGVDLSRGLLVGADFSGANLDGANLSGARLSDGDLSDVSLRGANLVGAILNGADLTGADLSGAKLIGSRLLESILVDANLTSADLEGSRFRNTNLSGANLTDANLLGASVEGWIDVGTVFCRTVEPNGSPINRNCDEAVQAAASTTTDPEENVISGLVASEFPSKPRQLQQRDADWAIISEVARAQRILAKLGYEPGTVDGLWGAKTRHALEQFYVDSAGRFDGSLDADDLAELEAAAAESGISAHPKVAWNYRATSIGFGGYEFADQSVYDMIKTIREIPNYGFNTVTLDFRCVGKADRSAPEYYPLGRRIGCSIANKQILEEEGFVSTRRDATSLAIDEAKAVDLAVNLKPMFHELGRRFGQPDEAGFGTMPLDVFFEGDGQTWSGYIPTILAVARYAQENDVEFLTIGAELNNLNRGIESDGRWPDIISKIRCHREASRLSLTRHSVRSVHQLMRTTSSAGR